MIIKKNFKDMILSVFIFVLMKAKMHSTKKKFLKTKSSDARKTKIHFKMK